MSVPVKDQNRLCQDQNVWCIILDMEGTFHIINLWFSSKKTQTLRNKVIYTASRSKLTAEPELKSSIIGTLWPTIIYSAPPLWKRQLIRASCKASWPLISLLVTKWFGCGLHRYWYRYRPERVLPKPSTLRVVVLSGSAHGHLKARVTASCSPACVLCDGSYYASSWLSHDAQIFGRILFWMLEWRCFLD